MYLCLLKEEKSKKMYIARVICICYNVRRQISVVNMFPYRYGNKKAPFEIVRISLRGLSLGFLSIALRYCSIQVIIEAKDNGYLPEVAER